MQIIPFNYKSETVRVIQDENGEPWWVAKNICKILGLEDIRYTHANVPIDPPSHIKGMQQKGTIEINLFGNTCYYKHGVCRDTHTK